LERETIVFIIASVGNVDRGHLLTPSESPELLWGGDNGGPARRQVLACAVNADLGENDSVYPQAEGEALAESCHSFGIRVGMLFRYHHVTIKR
jgi:hypothetical protein